MATLVLHGFTGSAAAMGALCDGLDDALAVDLPGHGSGPPSERPQDYTMLGTVTALVGLIDATGEDEVDVVGYSMGGRIALGLAVIAPARVRRLALVGASAGLADPAERAARRAADEALAEQIERDGVQAFVDHWETRPLFATQARLPPDVRDRIRAGRLANDAHGLARSLRGIGTGAQPPLHHRLDRVQGPVLCLSGELDEKFTAIAEDLATRLPEGRAETVPGVGHATHLEAPDATIERIRAFLAADDSTRSTR